MKYLLLLSSILLLILPAQSQVRKSKGSYDLNLSRSDLNEAEACQKCQELAMVKAIEKEFGTLMIQGNSMLLRSIDGQDSVVTNQRFQMMAESFVNGQWLETIESSCERLYYEDEFWLHCEVKGKIAPLNQEKFEQEFYPADCPSEACRTWQFEPDEEFYLHFTSATPGFLSVYLSDGESVQRLLPYRQIPAEWMGGMPVEADQNYVLFSRTHENSELWTYVDEYMWDESESGQLHRIYLIFSPDPHSKPILEESGSFSSPWPDQLQLADFQAWMAEQRRDEDRLTIQTLDVMVMEL